jgi:putative flippase GtrA
VSFALRLYERFRVLIHEAAKFGVVGLGGFIVSLGGADVLHFDLGVGKYKAVVTATIAATVVTFLGNRYWAFRHRERVGMGRETVLFFVFNGIGLLIQLACVAIVADGLGLQGKVWYNLANLTGIGLGTLFRFWSYRKWVWRTQDPAAGVQAGRHRPPESAPEILGARFPEAGVAEAVAVGLDEEATLYGRGAEEYEHGAGNYGAGPKEFGGEEFGGDRGQYAGSYDRRAGDYGGDRTNGSRPGRHAARS